MDKETIKVLMAEIPLFDQLTPVQRDQLSEYIKYAFYQKGKVVFSEGESGGSLYYIISGKVEVTKESLSGGRTVLAKYRKGVSIGEMSLVDRSTRSATVRTIEETEFLYLTKDGFESVLSLYPQTGIRILKNIAAHLSLRLRDASGKLADLAAVTKFGAEGRKEVPEEYKDEVREERRQR